MPEAGLALFSSLSCRPKDDRRGNMSMRRRKRLTPHERFNAHAAMAANRWPMGSRRSFSCWAAISMP